MQVLQDVQAAKYSNYKINVMILNDDKFTGHIRQLCLKFATQLHSKFATALLKIRSNYAQSMRQFRQGS